MYVVYVKIQVIPEQVEAFIEATKANALGTRQEPGNARFDVLRSNEDPNKFSLYEVYHSEQGFSEHQKTPHYLKWKETVAPMMAVPRTAERYTSVAPDPWV